MSPGQNLEKVLGRILDLTLAQLAMLMEQTAHDPRIKVSAVGAAITRYDTIASNFV